MVMVEIAALKKLIMAAPGVAMAVAQEANNWNRYPILIISFNLTEGWAFKIIFLFPTGHRCSLWKRFTKKRLYNQQWGQVSKARA